MATWSTAHARNNAGDAKWSEAYDHWIGKEFHGMEITGTDMDAALLGAVWTAEMYIDQGVSSF
jgi:hypothetical protein